MLVWAVITVAVDSRAHRQTATAQGNFIKAINRGNQELLIFFVLLNAACRGRNVLLGSEERYYRPRVMFTRGNVTVL